MPDRTPEQIAEQIVQSGYGYEQIKEAIAATIHAERAQTARLQEIVSVLQTMTVHDDGCHPSEDIHTERCRSRKRLFDEALREAAPEDRSHE